MGRSVPYEIAVNVPLAAWCCGVLPETALPPACAVVAAVIAHAMRWRGLAQGWLWDLSRKVRIASLLGISLGAAVMVLAIWVSRHQRDPSALIAAALVAIILLQRLPATGLSSAQLRVRYYVQTLGFGGFAVPLASATDASLKEHALLTVGGWWFAAGVMVTIAFCFANEREKAGHA
jgi:hypothetical protein